VIDPQHWCNSTGAVTLIFLFNGQVLSKLPADPGISHEEFKGALYLTLQTQLLLKPDWELQCRLWPILVRAQHNEKPSVAALLKSVIGYIHNVDNWTVKAPRITETALGKLIPHGLVLFIV
jgi:hypothetical protein